MNVIQIRWKTLLKLIKTIIILLALYLVLYLIFKRQEPSLKYYHAKREFFIQKHDKKLAPLQIKSVTILYSKISLNEWPIVLENAVNLGVNTIQIDIAWNAHQPIKNRFDFSMNSNDLKTFIELVHEYKLYLIVRIDPYIQCSSFDFGGLPSWLLGEDDLELRENNYAVDNNEGGGGLLNLNDEKFYEAFQDYLDNLLPLLAKHQLIRKGPIIGILTQNFDSPIIAYRLNSLSSFYNSEYIDFLRQNLDYYHFVEMLLQLKNICDVDQLGRNVYSDDLESILRYCDFNLNFYEPIEVKKSKKSFVIKQKKFTNLNLNCLDQRLNKYWYANSSFNEMSKPKYKEAYENRKNVLVFKTNIVELFRSKLSFNIKNYFCNSNFGFSNGAHHNENNRFLPISTNVLNSRYECLMHETGALTVKYSIVQKLLNENVTNLNTISHNENSYIHLDDTKKLNLVQLKINGFLPYEKIIANLHSPIYLKSEKSEFLSMEYISLNYNVDTTNNGYILYRAKVNFKTGYIIYIESDQIRDYSLLICDYTKHLITINNLVVVPTNRTIKIELKFDCDNLDILVENMGRLSDISNPKIFSRERKGIVNKDAITFKINEKGSTKYIGYFMWKIHFFDFLPKFFNRLNYNSEWINYEDNQANQEQIDHPFLSNIYFNVEKTNEAHKGFYLLMKNWHKGIVFLNGFNLGRYWKIGPLLTFFIPQSFLNDGKNELVIFEMHSVKNLSVLISKNHVVL